MSNIEQNFWNAFNKPYFIINFIFIIVTFLPIWDSEAFQTSAWNYFTIYLFTKYFTLFENFEIELQEQIRLNEDQKGINKNQQHFYESQIQRIENIQRHFISLKALVDSISQNWHNLQNTQNTHHSIPSNSVLVQFLELSKKK